MNWRTLWVVASLTTLILSSTSGFADPAPLLSDTGELPPGPGMYSVMQNRTLPEEPVVEGVKYSQVDAGSSFVCGIRADDHQINCWGLNDFGQLDVPGGKFSSISLGEFHGCGISKGAGHLICWGLKSAYGAAGDDREHFIAVSSGDRHTCAITSEKDIKCWGENDLGQSDVPKGKFISVSAKSSHTCAVSTRGKVACWGEPGFVGYALPTGEFKEVVTGNLHGCVLSKRGGRAVCWGNGFDGETSPPDAKFSHLTAGSYNTCGLLDNHQVLCWGDDVFGHSRWTQGDADSGDGYLQVAAGGEQTCALSRKRHLACHGSFAHNAVLFRDVYENAINAAQKSADGQMQPRFAALLNSFSMLSNFIGAGLITYGKSQDNPKREEVKMGYFQWGFMAVASALSFIGAAGATDATAEAIKKIQKDVEEIKKSIKDIDLNLNSVLDLTAQTLCDVQINTIEPHIKTIARIKTEYQSVIDGRVIPTLTAMAQRKPFSNPVTSVGGIRDFYLKNYTDLSNALSQLSSNVVFGGANSTSPAKACQAKSLSDWKKGATHPFDDRLVYKLPYEILGSLFRWQTEALIMLQELNLYQAYVVLTDTVGDKTPPVQIDVDSLRGFCADLTQNIAQNPRYPAAVEECKKNTRIIKELYVDMVRELEGAGAPYTDNNMILSMSPVQLGIQGATNDRNWLWIRDPLKLDLKDTYSPFKLGSFPPNVIDPSETSYSLYFYSGPGVWEGAWESNGQSWIDLCDTLDAKKNDWKMDCTGSINKGVKKGADLPKDFLAEMSTIKDSFDKTNTRTLFNGTAGNVFWVPGKKYRADWWVVVGDGFYNDGAKTFSDGMKCIIGSEIGRLCSSEDLGRVIQTYATDSSGGNTYGMTKGYWSASIDPTGMELYRYFMTYRIEVRSVSNIFPGQDALKLLYIPVVNVAERPCKPSMLKSGAARTPYLTVIGSNAKIATRCGDDMDLVINSMVQRPLYPSGLFTDVVNR